MRESTEEGNSLRESSADTSTETSSIESSIPILFKLESDYASAADAKFIPKIIINIEISNNDLYLNLIKNPTFQKILDKINKHHIGPSILFIHHKITNFNNVVNK